mgnify:CR=1 FL=1
MPNVDFKISSIIVLPGRVGLFYGNKTASQFQSFVTSVHLPGDLSTKLSVDTKPVTSVVEGGAQVQQLVNVACLAEFGENPIMDIRFRLV